ncbi:N-acetylmuramoyl-L-alanine amidase [Treponema phagedenis]|uniref:N-acetylmuramoyl-L-alanine amidase n=1 Tax=Treponema phagedenis TaxID=162 RepID=UPI0020917987|nr:N-acetylmuramoyl-L-alanine amidase [Treponema phagedenis]
MNIEKQMLTVNPFSRPGQKLQEVKGVVIHWVANPGTSAQANRNYFESLKRQKKKDGARYASAHFIIGITGDVLQCLPD